jgi:hypothetical protein
VFAGGAGVHSLVVAACADFFSELASRTSTLAADTPNALPVRRSRHREPAGRCRDRSGFHRGRVAVWRGRLFLHRNGSPPLLASRPVY